MPKKPVPEHESRYKPQYVSQYGNEWVCVVCGQVFTQKWDARQCCKDKKPYTLKLQEHTETIKHELEMRMYMLNHPDPDDDPLDLKPLFNQKHDPDKPVTERQPGDPDIDAIRLQQAKERGLFREYDEARMRFTRSEQRRLTRKLNHALEVLESQGKTPSPMRALAWAFHNHSWAGVRDAALRLATERFLRAEVNAVLGDCMDEDVSDIADMLNGFGYDDIKIEPLMPYVDWRGSEDDNKGRDSPGKGVQK